MFTQGVVESRLHGKKNTDDFLKKLLSRKKSSSLDLH